MAGMSNNYKTKIYLLLIVLFFLYVGTGSTNVMLGSAWPAISADIGAPITWQSIIIIIVSIAAGLGSATAQNLLARFRTWLPAVFGVALAIVNIFIFSSTASFVVMIACGTVIGYTIGLEGAIVNGFVARHYSAAAMNWLHCFYGAGCTLAPTIISFFIISRDSWRLGYQTIGGIQVLILITLAVSVPLWRLYGPVFPRRLRQAEGGGIAGAEGGGRDMAGPDGGGRDMEGAEGGDMKDSVKAKPVRELFRLPGSAIIIATMFVYGSFEMSVNSWTTSFLTTEKGFTAGAAAGMMTFYFGAQVAGRIVSSFLTRKYTDRSLIRISLFAVLAAVVVFAFVPDIFMTPVILVLGFTVGPLFPLLIHEVPSLVGQDNAQGVIGLQTAAANLSNVLVPVMIGLVAGVFGFGVFPVFLIALVALSVLLKTIQDRGTV